MSVGRRRLLADGTRDDSPLAKWISFELHTDGSGVFSLCVWELMKHYPDREEEPRRQLLQDEGIVIAVMSGLLQLARHARDRAAAGGNALVRAQAFPVSPMRPTGLGHNRFHGIAESRGTDALITQPPVAETTAGLDDLAQPCPELVAASALLIMRSGRHSVSRRWANSPVTDGSGGLTGATPRSSPGLSSTASGLPTRRLPDGSAASAGALASPLVRPKCRAYRDVSASRPPPARPGSALSASARCRPQRLGSPGGCCHSVPSNA